MLESRDRFLEQLRTEQHLFQFSPGSIAEFLRGLGVSYLNFEAAVFAFDDMYLVASHKRLTPIDEEQVPAFLTDAPNRRFALAMLDIRSKEIALKETLDRETTALRRRVNEIGADREAGLKVILDLQSENTALRQWIGGIKSDREARLTDHGTNRIERSHHQGIERSRLLDLKLFGAPRVFD